MFVSFKVIPCFLKVSDSEVCWRTTIRVITPLFVQVYKIPERHEWGDLVLAGEPRPTPCIKSGASILKPKTHPYVSHLSGTEWVSFLVTGVKVTLLWCLTRYDYKSPWVPMGDKRIKPTARGTP